MGARGSVYGTIWRGAAERPSEDAGLVSYDEVRDNMPTGCSGVNAYLMEDVQTSLSGGRRSRQVEGLLDTRTLLP